MRGKACILLAALALLCAIVACGDFNDNSPMLDGAAHTVQEANK